MAPDEGQLSVLRAYRRRAIQQQCSRINVSLAASVGLLALIPRCRCQKRLLLPQHGLWASTSFRWSRSRRSCSAFSHLLQRALLKQEPLCVYADALGAANRPDEVPSSALRVLGWPDP